VRFFHIPTLVYEWQTKPEYFTINKVNTLRQRLVADRRASEAVFAAYVMGHTQLGRLGILAGLRAEETRIDGSGTFQSISAAEKARRAAWVGTVTEEENLRRTQAEYGNRVDKEARYRNVFPGLHLRYDLGKGLQARASYSTGIGRPSFNTIIPNDSVNDTTQIVTSNNTGLKPQRGNSFDLSLEYYLNPAGLVSLGLFQKNVRDFIYTTDVGTIGPGVDNGFNGEYVGYLLRTQINGSSARMRGLELNFQQQFTNLPGFWRGFGLYANCTWLQTAGNYESQAVPHSGNVGISYIDYGWTVRVQENFTGRSVAGLSATPATQLHNYGKKKVDLNVSYRITRKLTVFADVINVFGDSVGGNPFYYIPGRKRGADKFNPEVKAGLSGRF
jgi:TonB-dependent receptor